MLYAAICEVRNRGAAPPETGNMLRVGKTSVLGPDHSPRESRRVTFSVAERTVLRHLPECKRSQRMRLVVLARSRVSCDCYGLAAELKWKETTVLCYSGAFRWRAFVLDVECTTES
jgi:hypothetical protein